MLLKKKTRNGYLKSIWINTRVRDGRFSFTSPQKYWKTIVEGKRMINLLQCSHITSVLIKS